MTALALYRDDGPLARALGRAGRLQQYVLVAAAALPLAVAIAVAGDGASEPLVGAVLAWLILLGGAASGAPPGGRLRWTQLPVLRACEYGALLWIAAIAGPEALPAAFALLAALAFRHYDLIYRARLSDRPPPGWLAALSLGWEGRLLGAYVLLLAGAVTEGFYVAAGVLAVAFVTESAASWIATGRLEQPLDYEDEEDEEA
jgi:Family of unknown function (DUF5941)